MKKGIFYSVGVGPGDPKLMTLQAVEIIGSCDVVAVPSSGAAQNIALKIAKKHIEDKEVLECDMPMTKDKNILAACHTQAADRIEKLLERGKSVAFLTLGDPAIYSTAMYVHNILTQRGCTTKLIPGIPSFCAVAASLNTSLCEGSDMLHIIPASYEEATSSLALSGNKVLMKSGKNLTALKEKISASGGNATAMMVECATMENEKVYQTLESVGDDPSYFSIILVKGELI